VIYSDIESCGFALQHAVPKIVGLYTANWQQFIQQVDKNRRFICCNKSTKYWHL